LECKNRADDGHPSEKSEWKAYRRRDDYRKKNSAVVRRLYEARGNPEIVRQMLAPDVRWEVVPGFPHSDVYLGLAGVGDFFTRLFSDFEDWHTEPSEFFETGDRVVAIGILGASQGDW
jgi:ketosteroid isomerase-like protein